MLKPRWIHFRSAVYLGGRGINFGSGNEIVPHASRAPHVFSLNADLIGGTIVDMVDDQFDVIADGKLDHVFVGPRLCEARQPMDIARRLARKVREGGHLVIAQKIGSLWHTPQEKLRVEPDGVRAFIADIGRWQAKDSFERDGWLLQIYKRIGGKKGVLPAKPRATKRACICRYGALGDMIMITPLIHRLHDDGYEVTMNISPYALPVIEHNPYVGNLVIQEREMIPNPELGEYWKEWQGDYDRYINLSESIEGRFLKVEGRRDFYTPKEWRVKTGEHNYYDYTMRVGGYPGVVGSKGELFFTNAEERDAARFFSQHKGKFVVVWALNGSSHHKVYPQMEIVVHEWLEKHPEAIIVTVGDPNASCPDYRHMRFINKAGEWGVRESLIAAKYASLVMGPETMMTNAAGSLGTPVMTMLSHSSHEALCKYFEKDYCLTPDPAVAPCHPCFQLHYTKESCPVRRMENVDTGKVIAESPACSMDAISPARVLARMEEVWEKHYKPNMAVAASA